MVEQRHAGFEAHGHGGAIDLHQDVVGQIADVSRAISALPGRAPSSRLERATARVAGSSRLDDQVGRVGPGRDESAVELGRVGAARSGAPCGPCRRAEPLRPARQDAAGGVAEPVQARPASRSSPRRRPTAAAGTFSNRVPQREREQVAVVAAEQLVAAVAGQRDRDVLRAPARRRGRSGSARSRRTARRTSSGRRGMTPCASSAVTYSSVCSVPRWRATALACRPRCSPPRRKPIVNVFTGGRASASARRGRGVDSARQERAERHVGHICCATASRSSAPSASTASASARSSGFAAPSSAASAATNRLVDGARRRRRDDVRNEPAPAWNAR